MPASLRPSGMLQDIEKMAEIVRAALWQDGSVVGSPH
jgi:hypothetical protein